MALDPSPKNDEVLPESPTGDQLSTGPRIDTSMEDPFRSSLSEWRSAMKAMGPSENIQVAGMGSDFIEGLRNWLWPPKSDALPTGQTGAQASMTNLESFTSKDIKTNSDKEKDRTLKISDLPVGGPHLEGRSKDVVTSLYNDIETANLELFDKNALTAAHRTLPFNTIVDLEYHDPITKVTRIVRGVRINDDGPHIKGNDSATRLDKKPRELDVSPRVARELGFTTDGVGIVKMTIVKWGDNKYADGVNTHTSGSDFRNKGRELREYWGRSNFSVYK
jgi:rare lipoprotein A (peptidoglycan hydrolase)